MEIKWNVTKFVRSLKKYVSTFIDEVRDLWEKIVID